MVKTKEEGGGGGWAGRRLVQVQGQGNSYRPPCVSIAAAVRGAPFGETSEDLDAEDSS